MVLVASPRTLSSGTECVDEELCELPLPDLPPLLLRLVVWLAAIRFTSVSALAVLVLQALLSLGMVRCVSCSTSTVSCAMCC